MEPIFPDPVPPEILNKLNRKELIELLKVEQGAREIMQRALEDSKKLNAELKDRLVDFGGIIVKFTNRLFGKSSERTKTNNKDDKQGSPKKRSSTSKLPSERYPNANLIERDAEFNEPPPCSCCGEPMEDSGMKEVSEYLQVISKAFLIIRQRRHKYRCKKCHGEVKTAPGIPKIKPGSTYSDEMVIDIAMSKFCDLIPIGRYTKMAAREGFPGLPANSLIEATHHLADFVSGTYDKVRKEVLEQRVLRADETTHRMLEGDKTSNWYLWGFSGETACYFEHHPTRSGDVAFTILKNSKCEILVSDVYSGYTKAVRIANEYRKQNGLSEITSAYCNAHARRRFKEASRKFPEESEYYIDIYKQIYALEKGADSEAGILLNRQKMKPLFEEMRDQGAKDIKKVSLKSDLATAINYLTGNLDGLTMCLTNPDVPIDNNAQERNLRNPVIGRKTWYGTHSKRGARTAAILFTLVESCKINKKNPRDYFKNLLSDLHQGKSPFTPAEYAEGVSQSLSFEK
jgi:transposase